MPLRTPDPAINRTVINSELTRHFLRHASERRSPASVEARLGDVWMYVRSYGMYFGTLYVRNRYRSTFVSASSLWRTISRLNLFPSIAISSTHCLLFIAHQVSHHCRFFSLSLPAPHAALSHRFPPSHCPLQLFSASKVSWVDWKQKSCFENFSKQTGWGSKLLILKRDEWKIKHDTQISSKFEPSPSELWTWRI